MDTCQQNTGFTERKGCGHGIHAPGRGAVDHQCADAVQKPMLSNLTMGICQHTRQSTSESCLSRVRNTKM